MSADTTKSGTGQTLAGAAGSAERICPKCLWKGYADRCRICTDETRMVEEVSCPDCYGGHFRPCQICGDSGVAWRVVQSPNAPSSGSAFDDWYASHDWKHSEKDTEEIARAAWGAAILAAAHECLEYAHSNTNVYRRNVSYACKRRVEGLSPNAPRSATGPAKGNDEQAN